MKTFILLMILAVNAQSFEIDKTEVILGGWSTHLFTDYKFNGTHDIKGLGIYAEGYYASLSSFKNSFYVDAYSLAVGKQYGDFVLGFNLATGYDKVGLNNIGKLALAPAVTYQPEWAGPVRLNLIANALFVNFAISLD